MVLKELALQNFTDGFRQLGLENGDTVFVQSAYSSFRRVSGGPLTIIQALLDVIGHEGTLIMPVFNWHDFGQQRLYRKQHTKTQTGVLSEILMEWPNGHRIYHPLHGFSLVGRRAKELAERIKNESSFETSSLFGELHRSDGKIMLLGVNYSQGFTFFHYIEESAKVPYRKFISLTGEVEELDGTRTKISMKYFGRASLDIHYDLNKLEPFLENGDNTLVKKIAIGTGTVRLLRTREVFDRLYPILKRQPSLVLV